MALLEVYSRWERSNLRQAQRLVDGLRACASRIELRKYGEFLGFVAARSHGEEPPTRSLLTDLGERSIANCASSLRNEADSGSLLAILCLKRRFYYSGGIGLKQGETGLN